MYAKVSTLQRALRAGHSVLVRWHITGTMNVDRRELEITGARRRRDQDEVRIDGRWFSYVPGDSFRVDTRKEGRIQ